MATPFELMQAMPYGLFDKRTLNPKARDEFAKRLLEEEAARKYSNESRLQAERGAQAKEIQKSYQQNQYDLDMAKVQAIKNMKLSDLERTARTYLLRRPGNTEQDPTAINSAAKQLAAEWQSAAESEAALSATRKAKGDIMGMGTDERIGPDVAAGEIAQAKLGRMQREAGVSDFDKHHEAAMAELASGLAINKDKAENPQAYNGALGNLLMGMQRIQAQAPVNQSVILKNEADAADKGAKAAQTQLRTEGLNKALNGTTPTGRLKVVGENIVPQSPTNNVPVRVNDPSVPGNMGLDPVIIPWLDKFQKSRKQ